MTRFGCRRSFGVEVTAMHKYSLDNNDTVGIHIYLTYYHNRKNVGDNVIVDKIVFTCIKKNFIQLRE